MYVLTGRHRCEHAGTQPRSCQHVGQFAFLQSRVPNPRLKQLCSSDKLPKTCAAQNHVHAVKEYSVVTEIIGPRSNRDDQIVPVIVCIVTNYMEMLPIGIMRRARGYEKRSRTVDWHPSLKTLNKMFRIAQTFHSFGLCVCFLYGKRMHHALQGNFKR